MNDTEVVTNGEAPVDAKKEVSLDERLKTVSAALAQVKAQIQQVEQQALKNQQQLQAAKDQLLSRGLELQGQEKLLKDLLGITDAPAQA